MQAREKSRAGECLAALAFHEQAGAAARYVGNNSAPSVQLRHDAEIDCERKLYRLPGTQAKVAGLDKHAAGTKVLSAAQAPLLARKQQVNGGAGPVSGSQSSLHCAALCLGLRCGWLAPIMHVRLRVGRPPAKWLRYVE